MDATNIQNRSTAGRLSPYEAGVLIMHNNNKESRHYNGVEIRQREDGFLDATAIGKAGNIRLENWWRQPFLLRYLVAMAEKLGLPIPSKKVLDSLQRANSVESTGLGLTKLTATLAAKHFPGLVQVKRGSPELGGGTWVHSKLGIRLAQESDEKFAVEVDSWVEEGLKSGAFEPESETGKQLSRILDKRCPWEKLYDKTMCDKGFAWFGSQFYWDYFYFWMTPEERCKLNVVNPLKKGKRKDKIHQWIEPETKERLKPMAVEMCLLLSMSQNKEQFNRHYQAAYGKGWQQEMF